jgi:nucleoside-diphosphate-sugar epimerase
MQGNPLRLFELVDRGLPIPLKRVENSRSMLYVGNLADAVRALLDIDLRGPEVLLVSDGDDVSTPQFIRAIARALDRPARLVGVPLSVFRAAGRVGDVLNRLVPFPLTSGAADRLLGSLTMDISRLRALIGYAPRYSMAEGLAVTASWYRARAGSAS